MPQRIELRVAENGGGVDLTSEQLRVVEAVSPTVDAERIEGGVEITVHDLRGTSSVELYDGAKGETGAQGPKGETGATGQQGPQGEQGIQGEQGPQGIQGEQGPNGEDGISPTVTVTDITGGHRVTIIDADGTHTFDVMDGETPSVPVQDVQINGTSVVSGGVANVPIAGTGVAGAVKVSGYGLTMQSNGYISTKMASNSEIKAGARTWEHIAPQTQHQSTFYGLAKAAGSDEKNSSLPVGQYTESAKSAISTMLSGSVSVSGSTPTITALPGIRYVCGEVATLAVTVPATGIIDVVFESGSTPTVLTVTPPTGMTMKWANGFDPTSLDASTTYEINIADGIYGVVALWT